MLKKLSRNEICNGFCVDSLSNKGVRRRVLFFINSGTRHVYVCIAGGDVKVL